jgi:hypothetical protein
MNAVVITTSNEEIRREIKSMKAFSKKVSATKESAREFLTKYGYMTKSGKLSSRYKK